MIMTINPIPPYLPFEFDRDLTSRLDKPTPNYLFYPISNKLSIDFDAQKYLIQLQQLKLETPPKPLSLYIHIPFCNTTCHYCAHNKIITDDTEKAAIYLNYLEKEISLISQALGRREQVIQLHLGGGSPSFLSKQQFTQLMTLLHSYFHFLKEADCFVEIDPRRISADTILHLAKLGFNRISLGVQDLDWRVQQASNRIQSDTETLASFKAANSAGFSTIQAELLYGLPLQTQSSFRRTLKKAISFAPTRITLYQYYHQPDMFAAQRKMNKLELPSQETVLDIMQDSVHLLSNAGYLLLGMNQFVKAEPPLAQAMQEGRLQYNFQGYATHADCDMIGLGVSAFGKVGQCYSKNTKDLYSYYSALDNDRLPIARGMIVNEDDILRRNIMQELLCRSHLSLSSLEETHDVVFADYFAAELGEIEQFQRMGLLSLDDEYLSITPKGRFLIRHILAIFDRYQHEQTKTRQTILLKTR
ncbi:oxygen-independent coproporphyrinogen III oxidase [Neisseriaceae bacterium TC5R-5]|nr:oxygen-independent coproporphyrinogen III oxidase [Neisseriaceae bacterium TC5R-5]